MRRLQFLGLGLSVLCMGLSGAGCSKPSSKRSLDEQGTGEEARIQPASTASSPPSASETVPPAGASGVTASAPPPAKPSTKSLGDWLRSKLPATGGGSVEEGSGAPRVVHRARAGDTALSIAQAYVDLTDVYMAEDLAETIAKTKSMISAPIAEGTVVPIPNVLTEPYKEPDQDRLGWPEDKVLRGIFLTGLMAGRQWIPNLNRLQERGLNAVVLDGKDYMGPVNYPSQAKVAVETSASKNLLIPNLARTVRFAHARGIRVILRLPCFHDPWAQKRAPRLSVQGNWGKPFPLGWLDPTNPEAQEYVFELAREMAASGADEVQLDYVRFPVQGPLKSAVLPTNKGTERSKIIKEFVKKVAAIVHEKSVKLSLDVFGVAATGQQEDIDALGQQLDIMGIEADALSPMVYPSHYDAGYMGFAVPANHPEIIGIGNKAAYERLKKSPATTTLIRPWLQAFSWRTSAYGPKYVAEEIASAEKTGVGWLLWDPGCGYGAAWAAIPKKTTAMTAAR